MMKSEEKGKKKLVPRLRFPEFRGEGEWELMALGDVANIVAGQSPAGKNYNDNGKGIPFYQGKTDFGEIYIQEPSTWTTQITKIAKKGDILMSVRAPVGALNISTDNICIGRGLASIQAIKSNWFLYYYLSFIQKTIVGNGGSVFDSITRLQIEKIGIALPIFPEQQKVADCLSSLDDVITAEAQKLDALKAHKKGLMQQLFPAEGETVPKLRFPEFRGKGEWEEKSIQELIAEKAIIDHLDGNHGALYPRAEEFAKMGIPYITANDFITGTIDFGRCKYLPLERAVQFKKGVAKDGDILFAHNATVGPVTKLLTDYEFVILSTTATYFRCNNKYFLNDFLKFALSSPSFIEQYKRVMSQSTRNQVPITAQRKFILQFPQVHEQHKIAAWLSSLDELITTQSDKINALKTHKKGLMQQLFPAASEVGA